jgi:hypothetical protein
METHAADAPDLNKRIISMALFASVSRERISVSVIVPVHQSGALLRESLAAVTASDLPRDQWELIVVDDGSTDDSALVAAQFADTVIRLPGPPRGPAYARNRGIEASRGNILAFIDADVRVHADALRRLVEALGSDAGIGAVSGTYDTQPTARDFVSQYRNLLRHFGQCALRGDGGSFWAGCGVVRRSVMNAVGPFNEWHFTRPQIEADELGIRIRANGNRLIADPEIRATHLKRWTLLSFVAEDLRDRRIAETRVLGNEFPSQTAVARWSFLNGFAGSVLVWFAVVCGIIVLAGGGARWGTAAAIAVVMTLLIDWPVYRFLQRARSVWFAVASVPLRLLTHATSGLATLMGSLLRHTLGEPRPDPTTEAFAEVGVKTWPPIPVKLPAPDATTTTTRT